MKHNGKDIPEITRQQRIELGRLVRAELAGNPSVISPDGSSDRSMLALERKGIVEVADCDYTSRMSGRHFTKCWKLTYLGRLAVELLIAGKL
jgi:hypothetical protein